MAARSAPRSRCRWNASGGADTRRGRGNYSSPRRTRTRTVDKMRGEVEAAAADDADALYFYFDDAFKVDFVGGEGGSPLLDAIFLV